MRRVKKSEESQTDVPMSMRYAAPDTGCPPCRKVSSGKADLGPREGWCLRYPTHTASLSIGGSPPKMKVEIDFQCLAQPRLLLCFLRPLDPHSEQSPPQLSCHPGQAKRFQSSRE